MWKLFTRSARLASSGLVAVILLAACATVPMMSKQADIDAKRFHTPVESANLYVVRPTQYIGFLVVLEIILDGKPQGYLATGTYFVFDLVPGEHTVATKTDGGVTAVKINAEAGRNYFVQVEPALGLMAANNETSILSDEEGRTRVRASKRANPLYSSVGSQTSPVLGRSAKYGAGKTIAQQHHFSAGTDALSSEQIKVLFTGKLVKGHQHEKGYDFVRYYREDGTLSSHQRGEERNGNWSVSPGGELCIRWQGGEEKCRIIRKQGSAYSKYKVNKKGQLKLVSTYSEFTQVGGEKKTASEGNKH
jgi:hypothetical protein